MTIPRSGHRRRVEQYQIVVQTQAFGAGLLVTAGHVQIELEDVPAQLLQGHAPGDDLPGVDVDQIRPALGQLRACGHLDHRHHGQAIRRAAAGGEDMQVHARRQLQVPTQPSGLRKPAKV